MNEKFNFDEWFLKMSNVCEPWDFPHKEKSAIKLGYDTCKKQVLKLLEEYHTENSGLIYGIVKKKIEEL